MRDCIFTKIHHIVKLILKHQTYKVQYNRMGYVYNEAKYKTIDIARRWHPCEYRPAIRKMCALIPKPERLPKWVQSASMTRIYEQSKVLARTVEVLSNGLRASSEYRRCRTLCEVVFAVLSTPRRLQQVDQSEKRDGYLQITRKYLPGWEGEHTGNLLTRKRSSWFSGVTIDTLQTGSWMDSLQSSAERTVIVSIWEGYTRLKIIRSRCANYSLAPILRMPGN